MTLALAGDVDAIASKGLLARDWQKRLPQNSAPYTSAIVFLRNRRAIRKVCATGTISPAGVSVITPNPKTSGGAQWNYLAAWGYQLGKTATIYAKAKELVTGYLQECGGSRFRRARLDDHFR